MRTFVDRFLGICALFVLFCIFGLRVLEALCLGSIVREEFQVMLGTATLSTFEWLGVEMMALSLNVFVNVVGTLVLGFIGLYVGSMFRRPVKS